MDSHSLFANQPRWPANQRAAVIVVVHVDSPNLADGASQDVPGLDYSATGLHRLLKAFADLDVAVTTAWSPRALSTYPQLARAAQDQGHELALSQVNVPFDAVDDGLFARISDIPVVGAVEALPLPDPGSHSDDQTTAGSAASMAWRITGAGGDTPVHSIGDNGQGTTVIPVSPYWIDLPWLDSLHPAPPSSLLEAWSLGLAAVRAEGGLMTIVVHPHISGRPGFAGTLVRFIDEVIGSGDVWIATAAQVAEWWRQKGIDQNELKDPGE